MSESAQTPQFTPVEKGGINSLASDHIEAMSDPSEHAIAAEREDSEKHSHLVDKSGTPFNPEIHATDDSGEPLKTQAGNWRKKPGRKPGDGPASSLNTKPQQKASTQDSGQQAAYVSAMTTVDSVGMVARALGGESYAYQRIMDETGKQVLVDERENGIEAFTRLYEQKGVTDIPPGVAVVLWGLMYLAPRLQQDKRAQSKIKLAWYWIRSKLTRKPMPKNDAKKGTQKEGE